MPDNSMLYSPGESPMSSPPVLLNAATLSTLLQLLVIFLIALLANRFVRVLSNLIIRPASGPSRAEQAREQQTRTLAGVVYNSASKVVWLVAILTGLDRIGINPVPALALTGLASLAVGFGALAWRPGPLSALVPGPPLPRGAGLLEGKWPVATPHEGRASRLGRRT